MTLPAARCSLCASCDVFASEDAGAIRRALDAVLEGGDVTVGESRAESTSSSAASLARLRETVRSRGSGAAWRRRLRLNDDGGSTWVYLNKQAAASGSIALCSEADESPLGPITLRITSPDTGAIIDWLAARRA
ncbi:MAG: hypothetical protein OXU86_05485 [Thaumarchaeota archaeon]|nr:hypothetical protein [Nitrososphaerota archaeon]MDD9809570.1 hypothetical protein [Nitrososphaerota archaeon]MDD9812674.1 hypothetical protein [Nitrososphaerota archaeon]MDD9826203.1 hypothetical protein [Nitrososphaerota archaeon]MDD9843596.1 hypothetical protein [Nitrososphaerota archaeon]